ncbi:superinfection immunity protein [Aliiglaciecola sp. CAU 1673]|uniref:superinfection immunity protein n=1 Tax=Aliiglaciecola sp. CAU 1673 TaxID=3032595 RepID=UPI0023DBC553|nr:superinfection immunity protein [Aliiglaciecola sp. CAU 1673]MDF2176907.1 superinfection immunity protein [Aliiglaciecola sp. CAU 1673]
MSDFINQFSQAWQQADAPFLVVFVLLFLLVYFLPALLAVFFNRRHLAKIAVLNIPAGFSLIAWGALMVWAVTGKAGEYIQQKLAQRGTTA